MANTKIYTVVKDGAELKELKTLAAAKKLADAEGAEVFCDGAAVYTPASTEEPADEGPVVEEPAVEEPTVVEPNPESYVLTAKMNVRTAPSLDADKAGIAEAGTVVEVSAIEDDWLHLTDGTFILYGGGKFAKKNS